LLIGIGIRISVLSGAGILMLPLLIACSPSEITKLGNEDSDFHSYEAPEPHPPTAQLEDGTVLKLGSKVWRENGKLNSNAELDESAIPINLIHRPGDALVIKLDSAVAPMEVDFRTFSVLTNKGIPASNIPDTQIKCGDDSQASCQVTVADQSVTVKINASVLTQGMNVVEAYYATQEEVDVQEGVNHYAVSWAIRVE
jgi:hypothetical protein